MGSRQLGTNTAIRVSHAYVWFETGYTHTVIVDQSDFVVAHHPSPVVRDARDSTRQRLYIHPASSQYTRPLLRSVRLQLTS